MIIQILTWNNAETIAKTLHSIQKIPAKQHIVDLGSNDQTLDICRQFDVTITQSSDRRDKIRNQLIERSKETVFCLEPWEIVAQGHSQLMTAKQHAYVSILSGPMLTKEIRVIAPGKGPFENPVYESPNCKTDRELNVVLFSEGGSDTYAASKLEQWKTDEPLSSKPYYYQACLLCNQAKWDSFLSTAEHYFFIDKTQDISNTMLRYYYAMVKMMIKKDYKSALQNLNLCLCQQPLMAEFWCLTGDVYYHLLHRFDMARSFYENAVILGSRRMKTSKWPMDIPKYNKYPNTMMESCQKILAAKGVYGNINK